MRRDLSRRYSAVRKTWGELLPARRPVRTSASENVRQPVDSACGYVVCYGPFYCPPDQRVYLDVSFFRELAQMGGPGDFAQARDWP
jgi:predicted metalloprotease